MTDLRYPIGRYEHDGPVTDDLAHWIAEIEALPEQMRRAPTVSALDSSSAVLEYLITE